MNSCGGEIILPPTKLCWPLGSRRKNRTKNPLQAQRNGGEKSKTKIKQKKQRKKEGKKKSIT